MNIFFKGLFLLAITTIISCSDNQTIIKEELAENLRSFYNKKLSVDDSYIIITADLSKKNLDEKSLRKIFPQNNKIVKIVISKSQKNKLFKDKFDRQYEKYPIEIAITEEYASYLTKKINLDKEKIQTTSFSEIQLLQLWLKEKGYSN